MKSEAFYLTISVLLILSNSSFAVNVFCYYESWAENFSPTDIRTDICTHITYAFAGLNDDGSIRLDETDVLRGISNLKANNSDLKVLFSVGGWEEGSEIFSLVARDAEKKLTMAKSAVEIIQMYNYDGIDIDWEYPAQRGGIPEDRENFVDMLAVLKRTLQESGDYLLTAAVASDPDDYNSYAVNDISNIVDFVNVMAYDFHDADEGKTGQNAPLYASSVDDEWEREYQNCDVTVHNWLNRGTEDLKLNMGIAFYGHSFQLKDTNDHGVGAPVVGPGINDGYLDYKDICQLTEGWTEIWDEEQRVPYKYKDDQWIGYDNPRSIQEKVLYVKAHGLSGFKIWAVDADDKDGVCGKKFALLQEIKDNLDKLY